MAKNEVKSSVIYLEWDRKYGMLQPYTLQFAQNYNSEIIMKTYLKQHRKLNFHPCLQDDLMAAIEDCCFALGRLGCCLGGLPPSTIPFAGY